MIKSHLKIECNLEIEYFSLKNEMKQTAPWEKCPIMCSQNAQIRLFIHIVCSESSLSRRHLCILGNSRSNEGSLLTEQKAHIPDHFLTTQLIYIQREVCHPTLHSCCWLSLEIWKPHGGCDQVIWTQSTAIVHWTAPLVMNSAVDRLKWQ